MALILNGTDGLSDVDGSASTPAIRGTDANTGIFFPAADTIAFSEGGAEVARFNSSGNLGIGTTSPARKLHVKSTDGVQAIFETTGASAGFQAFTNAGSFTVGAIDYTSSAMIFYTGNGTAGAAERMLITSGGNFLVGGTTPIGSDGNLLANADYTATYRSTGTASAYIHAFASDIGGTRTVKYAIYANGTAGAVSDQNLKKNIEPARDYLADLMNIEVVKYNWISDEENTPKELGYIAQQVETVFAGMVDEQTYNDGDGNPVTQKMLKKEVFIPMMLKAIQELNAKVEAQAAEIAALKAK